MIVISVFFVVMIILDIMIVLNLTEDVKEMVVCVVMMVECIG